MAYNRARFNLTEYNRKGIREKFITAIAAEQVTTSIGSALNNYLLGIFNTRVSTELQGANGYIFSASGAETVNSASSGELRAILSATSSEVVTETVLAASNVYPDVDYREEINAETECELRRIINAVSGSETITGDIAPGCIFWSSGEASTVITANIQAPQSWLLLEESADENVTTSIKISGVVYPKAAGTVTIQGNIALAANNWFAWDAREHISPFYGTLGSNTYLYPAAYELVSAIANAISVEEKVCLLNVTLVPGDQLVVDAENYNIWNNGENAIKIHSGDWIDELDRETIDIDISASSGSANLSATILYTERYL